MSNKIIYVHEGKITECKNKEKHQLGCSAEGHVNQILDARMRSKTQGWSKEGLETITKLRAAISNGATREDLITTIKR